MKKSNHKKQAGANNARGMNSQGRSEANGAGRGYPVARNANGIADWRLERPDFTTVEIQKDGEVRYEVRGNLNAPVPPSRDSKYLSKEQCIELYRWMLLNRKMEQQLEILYKQTKVVGGVYFGLGQEACSCAAAYALAKDDWFAPMIRNQGALLVRGFHPRDVMMQYMAKADSPTKGKDGDADYGGLGGRPAG